MRASGLTTIIFLMRFRAGSSTLEGTRKTPTLILLISAGMLSSSNGSCIKTGEYAGDKARAMTYPSSE